jgi:hypothetical protein
MARRVNQDYARSFWTTITSNARERNRTPEVSAATAHRPRKPRLNEVSGHSQVRQLERKEETSANHRTQKRFVERAPPMKHWPVIFGHSEVGRLVQSAALIGIIGSFPVRTGPSRFQSGDELNLHGCRPRTRQIDRLCVLGQVPLNL